MGYFSNGTEGMDYEEHYCRRCVHYGPEDGPGCPIWGAHLLYAYNGPDEAKTILDMLIPRHDGVNQQCVMWEPVGEGTTDDF